MSESKPQPDTDDASTKPSQMRHREVTVAVPQLVAMSAGQRSAAIDAVRALLLPAARGHQSRGQRAA